MSKLFRFFIPLVLAFFCPLVQASLSSPVVMQMEIRLKSGKVHSGFTDVWSDDDIRCKPLKNVNHLELVQVEQSDGKEVEKRVNPLKLLQEQSSNTRKISLYREWFSLNYIPESPKNKSEYLLARLSRAAWSPFKEVLFVKDIQEARVQKCTFLDQVAPVLDLEAETSRRLSQPALAMFADEEYPDGVVSLISYNPKFDSLKKLEDLLKEFAKKFSKRPGRAIDPETYWHELFEHEEEFRKRFLPKDVYLLIYHVQD